jgi:hypothetical protein
MYLGSILCGRVERMCCWFAVVVVVVVVVVVDRI